MLNTQRTGRARHASGYARTGGAPKAAPTGSSNALSKALIVFVFLLSYTDAFGVFIQKNSSAVDAADGNPAAQVIWSGVYLLIFCMVIARWRSLVRVSLRSKLLLLLVGIALASVLWSLAPEVTFRHGVALVGTTLIGAYLAARFSLGEQLRLLAWALGIAAVLSLLFALSFPFYGVSIEPFTEGSWEGIFNHKNNLGSNMALGALVFVLLATSSRRHRWLLWGGFALSVSLILLADSATSLLVLLTLLALWPLYRALRWTATLAVPVLIVAVLLIGGLSVWLLGNTDTVLNFIGREETLTGRTDVWPAVLDSIWQRPWLGHGYGAFWLGWEGKSAYVWLASGQPVSHAHNSILDLWLGLGLLGVSVFSLGFLLAFFRAAAWTRSTKSGDGLWPLLFLTFLLLSSLSESVILEQNSALWILYVATLFSVFARPGQSRATPGASHVRRTPSNAPGRVDGKRISG